MAKSAVVEVRIADLPEYKQWLKEFEALQAKIKRVEELRDLWASQGHHAQWRAKTLTEALEDIPSKWRP